jgi:dihydroorotase
MPVNDTISVTEAMLKRAAESGLCRLIPIAALSCGLKGEAITEMGELSRSDVIAVSNADEPVASARFLRTAMEYASNFNLHVITFCEDKSLAEGGMMHEGSVSVFSGLSGIPSEAEEITAARNIAIAGMTGVKLHLVKISAASTLKHIKSAKERGLKISASVTPHHLTLDHNAVKDYDVNVKVKPPIRSEHDRKELIQALKAGVIDMICTDHAPQHDLNKQYEFDYAAYGMTGFQTSVPLLLNLVRSGDLTAKDFVRVLSESPARIFGTEGGSISKGNPADVAIIDPDASWVFDEKTLKSKSSNSPFFGQTLKGEVVLTMKSGKVIYRKSN